MDFSNAIIKGVPLILVTLGLVEWIKRLGVEGKWINGASMAIGIILGLLYQVSIQIPADFAGWFSAAVYGMALGLVASGVYDAVKSASKQ